MEARRLNLDLSHGGRDPTTWAITCCLPRYVLAGSWSWEPSRDLKPGFSNMGCRRPKGVLTTPNVYPSSILFFFFVGEQQLAHEPRSITKNQVSMRICNIATRYYLCQMEGSCTLRSFPRLTSEWTGNHATFNSAETFGEKDRDVSALWIPQGRRVK